MHCENCGGPCKVFVEEGHEAEGYIAHCSTCNRLYAKGRRARDWAMNFAKEEGIKPLYDRLGDPN